MLTNNKKLLVLSFCFIALIMGFTKAEKKTSYVKGKLGETVLNITENGSMRNTIRNSNGESATECFTGYTAAFETRTQDTMIFIGINNNATKTGACTPVPIGMLIKKGKYELGVSGSKALGTFSSFTIKISGNYYSTSLKAQAPEAHLTITSVVPFENKEADLNLSNKSFHRVDGKVSGRLYNAMVKGDFVDVKDISFSVVFAENK